MWNSADVTARSSCSHCVRLSVHVRMWQTLRVVRRLRMWIITPRGTLCFTCWHWNNIYALQVCLSFNKPINIQAGSRDNTSDLYLKRPQFESRTRHRLTWIYQPVQTNSGVVSHITLRQFPSTSFLIDFTNCPIIWWCIALNVDIVVEWTATKWRCISCRPCVASDNTTWLLQNVA